MATVIKASCGDCGDVELRVNDLRVRICGDADAGSYVFRFPSCRMSVVKHAEARIVDMLVASSVTLETWQLPAQRFAVHDVSPLSHHYRIHFLHIRPDEHFPTTPPSSAPL